MSNGRSFSYDGSNRPYFFPKKILGLLFFFPKRIGNDFQLSWPSLGRSSFWGR